MLCVCVCVIDLIEDGTLVRGQTLVKPILVSHTLQNLLCTTARSFVLREGRFVVASGVKIPVPPSLPGLIGWMKRPRAAGFLFPAGYINWRLSAHRQTRPDDRRCR